MYSNIYTYVGTQLLRTTTNDDDDDDDDDDNKDRRSLLNLSYSMSQDDSSRRNKVEMKVLRDVCPHTPTYSFLVSPCTNYLNHF